MKLNNNQQAFIALVRSGLWEKEDLHVSTRDVDFSEVYRLAEEQAVVGLVAAGIEHVKDIKPSLETKLTFAGSALRLEQRNLSMNKFIANLVGMLRNAGVYTLLVKGQGLAQCYERPLWRACGDVDLFLSNDNYKKAFSRLTPLAERVDEENPYTHHLAMNIDSWEVELHGSLRSGLWKKLDTTLDEIQNDVFCGGNVRSWMNGNIQVFLPGVDEDVAFVFSHILQHFYQEGIGLRQICDWCRILWTYRDSLNHGLLENRLHSMGVMTEWRAFASLAVDFLGMPVVAMPLYSDKKKWSRKANKIMTFIFITGNFGHNRDYSYYEKYSYLTYKVISLWRHTKDGLKYFAIFPVDSIKVWWSMIKTGFSVVNKGK